MRRLWLSTALLISVGWSFPAAHAAVPRTEAEAENMLLLQTASGGWPKHWRGRPVDYARTLDEAERQALARLLAQPPDGESR